MTSAISSASLRSGTTSAGASTAASARRFRSGATLVAMKLTGLLISCATPATSRPSEAIFSDWTSCTSVRFSSE